MLKRGLQPQFQVFSRIDCREDALRFIRYASWLYFAVAILDLARLAAGPGSSLFDAAYCATASVLLGRYQSRIVAVALCAMNATNFLLLIDYGSNTHGQSGVSLMLSAFLFCLTLRAVEATFKLHGRFAAEVLPAPKAPGA